MQSLVQPLDPTERLAGCVGRWQCDLSDNSIKWSPPVFALFGLDPATPIERDAIVAMYESDSRALMEGLRARAIAERGSFTMEARIRRTDGALRWIRLTADIVCRDGRPTHLYGTKQDITPEMAGS